MKFWRSHVSAHQFQLCTCCLQAQAASERGSQADVVQAAEELQVHALEHLVCIILHTPTQYMLLIWTVEGMGFHAVLGTFLSISTAALQHMSCLKLQTGPLQAPPSLVICCNV